MDPNTTRMKQSLISDELCGLIMLLIVEPLSLYEVSSVCARHIKNPESSRPAKRQKRLPLANK